LQFHDVELVVREAPENLEFIQRFVPKIDWEALVDTARQLGDTSLPPQMPESWTEEQLRALHHVLMEVGDTSIVLIQIHVEEGSMNCRGCGHVYPISNGIPNMVSSNSRRCSSTSYSPSMRSAGRDL
jgi:multifunctional methyltransferase subunit TRM112